VKYWFEIEDAQRWGLPAAAVLSHLRYWIERNEHETGRPCVTQTVQKMGEYLPFLSAKQIRRSLVKLVDGGVLERERNGFDPVYTYCLIDEREIREPKGTSADDQKGHHVMTQRDISTYRNNKTEEKTHTREELEYQRPTEQEVIQYMEDRGAHELAATLGPSFWNYYEANGWMVNGTPIAKWKPKANQWINTERNKHSNERRKGFNPAGFTPDGLKDFIDNG
jgi:hypothetical protein